MFFLKLLAAAIIAVPIFIFATENIKITSRVSFKKGVIYKKWEQTFFQEEFETAVNIKIEKKDKTKSLKKVSKKRYRRRKKRNNPKAHKKEKLELIVKDFSVDEFDTPIEPNLKMTIEVDIDITKRKEQGKPDSDPEKKKKSTIFEKEEKFKNNPEKQRKLMRDIKKKGKKRRF